MVQIHEQIHRTDALERILVLSSLSIHFCTGETVSDKLVKQLKMRHSYY